MKKITLLFSLIILLFVQVSAQQIREQDIVYSRHIVREIDLRHAANKAVFGKGCTVPVILLGALKTGAKAYSYEHPEQQISYEEVQEKLWIRSADSCSAFYAAEELYVLELTETFIFDKNTF